MTLKNLLSKVIILLLFVVLIASGSSLAYSYFDSLSEPIRQTITVGEWMEPISTPQEFYDFATKTDSVSEDRYYLTNDLDFSGFTWELDALNNDVVFKGVLHYICGADMKSESYESVSKELLSMYGEDVFNLKAMADFLPAKIVKALKATIEDGAPLPEDIQDDVAEGMKKWAISKGATHYTHWFLPLTGLTAEKHDAFIHPTKSP